jgi:hypothetical protein
MNLPIFSPCIALLLTLLLSTSALAGRPCAEGKLDVDQAVKATQMADTTLTQLNTWNDDVVLIGRVGADLSQYGLEYSHMAFAVRQGAGWSVIHELNECGTAESSLYDQGLIDFFSDEPFKYKAAIWRLKPDLQKMLLRALSGKAAKRLHEVKYNMVAYPFSTQFQNSNGWVLEVLAYGLAPIEDVVTREDAQAWLKGAGYTPTQLQIGTMTRLGARLSRANVSFEDHPPELRWADKIQTTSVASVISFLGKTPGACLVDGCPATVVTLPVRTNPTEQTRKPLPAPQAAAAPDMLELSAQQLGVAYYHPQATLAIKKLTNDRYMMRYAAGKSAGAAGLQDPMTVMTMDVVVWSCPAWRLAQNVGKNVAAIRYGAAKTGAAEIAAELTLLNDLPGEGFFLKEDRVKVVNFADPQFQVIRMNWCDKTSELNRAW